VEIKGQLDATEWFFLQNLLLAQHVSGTIMPIIWSSGAQDLYSWLLPMVLDALVYRSLVWRGAVGYASGLRELHTKRSPTQRDIYQMLCWYTLFSWWWARGYSKHV